MKTFINLTKMALIANILFFAHLPSAQCLEPTGVTISNITSTTATISWTASASAPGLQYQFEIRTAGAPGSGNTGLIDSGDVVDNQLSVNITELNISTNYNIYVRYQCSIAPNVFSVWSSAVPLTTTIIETPVANPGTNVSDTFFSASWQIMNGVSNYLLDVSTASDFSSFVSGYENVSVVQRQKLVFSLTASTTYYYRVRAQATGGAGLETSANSNVISVTTLAVASSFIVWTENGWIPDIAPTINLDVIIDFDYNSAVDGINFPFTEGKSLTINSGAQFTLGTATSLIIENEIVNNAGPTGFIIENNASLVQNQNSAINTGKITVKRNSSALFRLDYTMWASPTSDIPTDNPQTLKAFSPGTTDIRFYNYNTSTDLFSTIANPDTVPFEVGIGYMIRIRNNHVPYVDATSVAESWQGSFVGTPNNGIINVPLSTSGSGYNLIGNPYPSVISAENFIADNEANIEGTIYFWRRRNNVAGTGDTGSFYATYTSLGGTGTSEASDSSDAPNGFIQVGQGFLVQAKPAGTEVVFQNSLRQFEEFDDQFFRTNSPIIEIEKHRIWLNLTNASGVFSQLLVGYAEGATNGIDNGFDGKFIKDTEVALTSLIDYQEFSIQAKALPFANEDTIPLGFKVVVAGQYTISLNDFDGLFDEEQGIYLYDNVSQTIHDLKESAYVFAAESGVQNDRFQLRFTNETLGIQNPFDAKAVVVSAKENRINIEAGSIIMNNVALFDIQGRKLLELTKVNSSNVSIESIKRTNQVLLIQITDDQNNTVTKKLIF
jgi:hypothetical protein